VGSEDCVGLGPDSSGTSNCCTSGRSGIGMSSLNAIKSSSKSLRVATDKGDNWGTIGEGDSGSRVGKSSSDGCAELGMAKTSKCGAGNISKTNGTSCEIGRSGTTNHDGRMLVGMLGTRTGGVSKAGATLPGIFRSKSESEVLSNGPETLCRGCHWGQGYPETSGNILGTFQGLGQFYCTVTNRHIYGTFEMCC